jgi:hypothetical protein
MRRDHVEARSLATGRTVTAQSVPAGQDRLDEILRRRRVLLRQGVGVGDQERGRLTLRTRVREFVPGPVP